MCTEQTADVGKVLRQPAVWEAGCPGGLLAMPLPHCPRPGQARLLGHQCPLETVSVGSEGAVRQLWREKSLDCGSTRAARGGAALRISKHLFGVALEGWWDPEE